MAPKAGRPPTLSVPYLTGRPLPLVSTSAKNNAIIRRPVGVASSNGVKSLSGDSNVMLPLLFTKMDEKRLPKKLMLNPAGTALVDASSLRWSVLLLNPQFIRTAEPLSGTGQSPAEIVSALERDADRVLVIESVSCTDSTVALPPGMFLVMRGAKTVAELMPSCSASVSCVPIPLANTCEMASVVSNTSAAEALIALLALAVGESWNETSSVVWTGGLIFTN